MNSRKEQIRISLTIWTLETKNRALKALLFLIIKRNPEWLCLVLIVKNDDLFFYINFVCCISLHNSSISFPRSFCLLTSCSLVSVRSSICSNIDFFSIYLEMQVLLLQLDPTTDCIWVFSLFVSFFLGGNENNFLFAIESNGIFSDFYF